MRLPSREDLVHEPLLGTFAVVEVALMVLARTLGRSHPEADRVDRPDDDPVTAGARQIIDACELLLYALDHFRDHLSERGHRPLNDPDWPF